MRNNFLKYLSLGGMAGPILFTVIIIISGSLRPGYDHLTDFISELGADGSAYADLMNFAGFIPSGIFIALFGISLFFLLPGKMAPKIGAVLVTVFGIGVALAGIFSCDPGCPVDGSTEAIIHDRVSVIAFISGSLGYIILGLSFLRLPEWRSLWIYTLISGILAIVFLVVMINSVEAGQFTGLWQRLFLLTLFQWLFVVSLQVRKG